MIIIVEGIDRVGKTTLINKLAEECNVKPFVGSYLKFTYTDLKSNEKIVVTGNRNNIVANTEKINSLVEFFEQFPDKVGNVVFDRLHFSEFVYGLVDRNYFSIEAFKNLDNRLSKLNALVIYVEPKDLKWSSEQHGSSLAKHLNAFEEIIDKTKCEVIRCNFDTIEDVVLRIKEKVEKDGSC